MNGPIVSAVIGAVLLIGAVFAFLQKGPIWTTQYFSGTKTQRQAYKTKESYHFVGRMLLGMGLAFIVMGISFWLDLYWLTLVALALAAITVVHTIVVQTKRTVGGK